MRARSLVCFSLLCAGCSGGTDLENPEHVAAWANSASSLAVYVPAYEPVGLADGEVTLGDGACPAVDDDGTTLVITGGCTTGDGKRFEGTTTVVRVDPGYDVTFDAYGSADEGDTVPRLTGTFTIRQTDSDLHSFDADYVQDGLLSLDVDYSGTVQGGYERATVWSGSGTVTRGGFTDASGTAEVSTLDQRRDDDVCRGEAASGTTTVELGGRTLVVAYDGATACDEDHSARFSVDGEDLGTVPGITCAATPGRGGSWWLLAPLAALALLIRRRR